MMIRSFAFLSAILLAPFAALLAVSASPTARAADYIWIEGESPRAQTMARHPWWYDKVKKNQLSGDDFISN